MRQGPVGPVSARNEIAGRRRAGESRGTVDDRHPTVEQVRPLGDDRRRLAAAMPATTRSNTPIASGRGRLPLVVLVDENSASASEIFAAAVQENGRGLVVGRRTYGKGTVQTHFPLQSVPGILRLTTAQFFSPTGRTMAGAGVEPDVHVEAEHAGRHAYYEHEAPSRHECALRTRAVGRARGISIITRRLIVTARPTDARFLTVRTGTSPRRMETATSQQVFDLAQAAGSRRDGNSPGRPVGR